MHPVLSAGIELILWLQQAATPPVMHAVGIFTNFGGRWYLLTLPLVIWCVDFRLGLRLLPVFTVSLWLNALLKVWFAEPRPFQVDSRVLSPGAPGYGLPSGHAQQVVVFWGMIAGWVRRAWFWYLALAMMFLIGLSRVFLGVHFPSDVVVGWALGFAILWLWFRFGGRVTRWYGALAAGSQVGWLAVLAAVLFAINEASFGVTWANAMTGFLLGAGVGGIVAVRCLAFRGHGRWWVRIARYLLGMGLTLLLIDGLQRIGLPAAGGLLVRVVLAADLALIGLWLTLIAPALFQLVRLGDAPAR